MLFDRVRSVLSPDFTTASLADVLARTHGERVAVSLERPLPYQGFSGETLTCEQIRDFVGRAATVLERDLGVQRGDRVAVCTSNDFDFLLFVLAVFRLGAVAVPLGHQSKRAEISYVLESSRARVLLIDRGVWDRAFGDPGQSAVGSDPLPAGVRCAFAGPASSAPPGMLSFDEALGRTRELRDAEPIRGRDTAAVFYTSGTTGLPKGAMLTSEGLTARGRPLLLYRAPRGALGVAALPLAHIMGFLSALAALLAGIPIHHLPRFDAERVLEVIDERRATVFVGVPAMYRMMADAGLDRFDLGSVRFWASAADRMPADLIGEFKRRGAMFRLGPWHTEAIFVDTYGSVELAGAAIVRFSPPGVSRWDGTFVGIPIPPFRAKVCDDGGREVRRGDVGELWIRGPGLLEGYLGDEEATRAVTSDGWVRTGDLASQDRLGLIRFVDRKKDVIKCGGYSVFPAEIEHVLGGHPAVDSAVAFGVPHPTKREMPVAIVTERAGARAEPDALLAWARERLADYKAPRRVWVVQAGEIPRNPNLKVLRTELRDRYRETFLG